MPAHNTYALLGVQYRALKQKKIEFCHSTSRIVIECTLIAGSLHTVILVHMECGEEGERRLVFVPREQSMNTVQTGI